MPNDQSTRPRFPKRPLRLDLLFSSVQPFYFVTFNTHKRLELLARTEVHDAFRSFCTRAEELAVAVGRYVIMPDHVHLFVFSSDRNHASEMDSRIAHGYRQDAAAAGPAEAALAGKAFSIMC